MILAVPMANGSFSEHFGGATHFALLECDPQSNQLTNQQLLSAPKHEPGSLPRWLATQHVDAVIASAMGERALIMLADAGIAAYLATGPALPAELARACLLGKLPRLRRENSQCQDGHDHHGDHECHP